MPPAVLFVSRDEVVVKMCHRAPAHLEGILMARKLKSRDSESAVVTIAAIRKPKAGVTQYLFNERHQIFTMPAAGRFDGKKRGVGPKATGARRPPG